METTYHFTREQLRKALDGAVEMYLEFYTQHDYDMANARHAAVQEVIEGLDADRELVASDPAERLRLQLPA